MSDKGDMSRLMEKLRNDGKLTLRVNPENGEMEGTLTPEGEEEARALWRQILDMPDDAPKEEVDKAIAAAYPKMMREREEGDGEA
jgi:hypothetical protein